MAYGYFAPAKYTVCRIGTQACQRNKKRLTSFLFIQSKGEIKLEKLSPSFADPRAWAIAFLLWDAPEGRSNNYIALAQVTSCLERLRDRVTLGKDVACLGSVAFRSAASATTLKKGPALPAMPHVNSDAAVSPQATVLLLHNITLSFNIFHSTIVVAPR